MLAAHPLLKHCQMRCIVSHIGKRHLVRAKCTFNWQTIDFARPCPSFRRPQNDRRPLGVGLGSVCARVTLNAAYPRVALIKRSSERLMNVRGIGAFDKERLVTSRLKKSLYAFIWGAAECRRPCDFVSIQMQDRQHRTIARGIQILDALPRSGEWACFRFAVSNHSSDNQIRIVECCAERVREDITESTAFMN